MNSTILPILAFVMSLVPVLCWWDVHHCGLRRNRVNRIAFVMAGLLCFSISGCSERRSPEEAMAIAEIKKIGGIIEVDASRPGRPVIEVMYLVGSGPKSGAEPGGFTDAEMKCLRWFPELCSLEIHESAVSDAGFEHLGGLRNLQFLTVTRTNHYLPLTRTNVSDAGLAHLRGLTNLRWLVLSGANVSDEGLKHLQGLPNLELLILDHTKVTGVGLKYVKELGKLDRLILGVDPLTDAGLKNLPPLPNLHTLDLAGTEVSDGGLEHLRGLTNLQSLDLLRTNVTDVGLVHLKALANLHFLNLNFTKVTDQGVKNLQQALPKCEIVH
jgi:hypothetical protein